MIKKLLLSCFITITMNSFGVMTHVVTKGLTTNVTCDVGDTIKFYGQVPGAYGVTINSTGVITPHVCSFSPYYIGFYVIVGGETSFTINSSPNWSGTITVNPSVGISKSTANEDRIRFYPNPFTNNVKVNSATKAELKLFNITGKEIAKQLLNEGSTEFDFSSLASGIYFARIGESTFRIVKE